MSHSIASHDVTASAPAGPRRARAPRFGAAARTADLPGVCRVPGCRHPAQPGRSACAECLTARDLVRRAAASGRAP